MVDLTKIVERLKASDRSITALAKMPERRPGRTFPPYSAKAIADYGKLVGEVTWASNRLHATMAGIFAQLVQPGTQILGLSIWNSVKTDSAQRDMLKGATMGRMDVSKSPFARKIIWLCDAVGKISAYRNDAVHTPMITLLNEKGKWAPVPDSSTPMARAERLDEDKFWRLFRLLRGDFIELDHYACGIFGTLASQHFGQKPEPLPKRPLLRSHVFLSRIQAQKPQKQLRRRGRKPRRRASRPKVSAA